MAQSQLAAPLLTGRHVRLRPIMPADYEYLYVLTTHEKLGWRWRYRGATPSPELFQQQLWQGVAAQFVIEHVGDQKPIGFVQAFDPSDRNGHCHFAIVLDPALERTGWALEALLLFLDYLFTIYNFRKLYAEVPEFNYASFASGNERDFKIEGRLREHDWHAGRYWDLFFLAVYREDWERRWHPKVQRLIESQHARSNGHGHHNHATASASTPVLTLDEFCAYLADQLGLDPAALDPDADVRTELGLESIQMFAMLIAVEDLGVSVPDELMPHILTLRDAFAQYENSLAHRP
jgi:RimJ/RimL family protein N-acetyltransferase/acyl carrier protein